MPTLYVSIGDKRAAPLMDYIRRCREAGVEAHYAGLLYALLVAGLGKDEVVNA